MMATGKTSLATKIEAPSATGPLNDTPKVVTHTIPQIHVYQVTEDELGRLQEGCGQVGQDLTFACTSLGIFVGVLVALLVSPMPRDTFLLLLLLCLVSGAVCSYTGVKCWRSRKEFRHVLAKIRSRKDNTD
jgi:hypothetical protein